MTSGDPPCRHPGPPPSRDARRPAQEAVPRRVRRLYGILLLTYPRRTRRTFGPQMQSLFEDCWREARDSGRLLARNRLWLRTLADVAFNAALTRLRPTDRSRSPAMDLVLQDLRHTLRSLRKAPGFTAAVVGTLALGIGSNTAIFSVVDGVLLAGLPYPEADRLVRIYTRLPDDGIDTFPVSNAEFLDYRAESELFVELGASAGAPVVFRADGGPQRLPGAAVSAGLWQVLGVEAALERTFGQSEDRPGSAAVVLLSHDSWQGRFGGDPAIVGRTLILDETPTTVIGVMPEDFPYPSPAVELWLPLRLDPAAVVRRDGHYLSLVGRLRPGVGLADVRSEMQVVFERWRRAYDHAHPFHVVPLHEQIVGDSRRPLVLLAAAVGLVLLVACTNVAGLLLARASRRAREIGVRAALGASRRRLVAQLLAESGVLALAGGLLGLLLAHWGVDLLMSLEPGDLPRLEAIGIDGRVLAFTLAASLLTGLAFGLAPALQATRRDIAETLAAGGRGATAGRRRSRRTLVVAEVAVATVLLVGAGLLVRSFARLRGADPGIVAENVLTARVDLASERYAAPAAVPRFFAELAARLEAHPGIESAAMVRSLPFWDRPSLENFWRLEDRSDADRHGSFDAQVVTPGYFRTLGIPIVAGRPFSGTDREEAPRVAIVSKALADAYFPDGHAVGARIGIGFAAPQEVPFEIVGMTGDVLHHGLAAPAPVQIYLPLEQAAGFAPWLSRNLTIVARTRLPAAGLADDMRRTVWSLDGDLPVSSIQTMQEVLGRSLARPRFLAGLMAVFSALALVLAAVGLYGLIAFGVVERAREFAVRMALGARPADVRASVVRQGMLLATTGIVLGLTASWALGRLLGSLLFEVETHDPATRAVAAVFLAAIALLATWAPARRATRIDPIETLRNE